MKSYGTLAHVKTNEDYLPPTIKNIRRNFVSSQKKCNKRKYESFCIIKIIFKSLYIGKEKETNVESGDQFGTPSISFDFNKSGVYGRFSKRNALLNKNNKSGY